MKKLLIISSLFLLSCAKEKRDCWHCACNVPATGVSFERNVCGYPDAPPPIRDAQGNDTNCFCERK